ncbi:hypothetical protein GCM10009760_38940 [Kitasatospora kazusensis]|uniref:DUF2568 domain-containing protein n=1 Tax=Kitasatospora kazusensis TaxID=407974 RepID=A0ABN2ZUT1_9ACTN
MLSDTLAFLLELAVYAAVGHYGWTRHHWTAGVGLVLVFAAAWGVLGAPSATIPLHGPGRAVLEILWYGGGAGALVLAGRPRTAVVFVLLYLLSTAIQHL